MKNALTYRGYTGTVDFSNDDEIFFGKIIGINDLVTFEADTVQKLKRNFKDAVDDYIDTCAKLKKDPDKEYKGSFNVRVKPSLHRKAAIKSASLNISLNQLVEKALEKEVTK
ncbi:MAG TPA: type II toxin-antitoxin system HicB family antitoxin [Cyclobacteriaceae bacterium]|nr:type II toxin-antitoxin system HicB family antitoxin [Cyclobacteriaceae bacterium]